METGKNIRVTSFNFCHFCVGSPETPPLFSSFRKRGNAVLLWLTITCLSMMADAQENADMLIMARDYDGALKVIEKQLADQNEARLWYLKGIIQRERFDYLSSLDAFMKAVTLDTANIIYLTEGSEAQAALGNVADAVQLLNRALKSEPDNQVLKSRLGKLLISQQDYKEAYKVFTQLALTDSLNLFYIRNLAITAYRLDKNKEAARLFEKVLLMNPRDYSSYLNLATIFQQDTAFLKARKVIENGLGQFPGNAGMMLRLAQIFFAMEEYGLSVETYGNYLADNDTVFNIRKEYGAALYLNKQEEAALKILEPALYIAPNDPIIPFYVGLCYKSLKRPEPAKRYLLLAQELALPGYMGSIYRSLGEVHGMLREFPESLSMYQKAYAFDPQEYELLFEMATTYEEFHADKTAALNYYKQYLEKSDEKSPNRKYALVRINKIQEDRFFNQGEPKSR